MPYPTLSDYSSALRHPHIAFRKKDPKSKQDIELDPILVKGKPVEITYPTGMKTPWSAAGGFACAFKYETFSPNKFWAVRCFTKSTSDVNLHYPKVSQNLQSIQGTTCASYFVNFNFFEEGIRVNGTCYPTVRMEWVEGETLRKYIKAHINDCTQLKKLAKSWIELSKALGDRGIAHGDLQHGNILIDDRQGLELKLIDYDSLYFATDGQGIEDKIKGIPDYQHPLRNSLSDQCPELDFFSQLVIYLSILALADDPSLWDTFKIEDAEHLLFSKHDFSFPDNPNNMFQALAKLSPPVAALASKMKKICQLTDFKLIPSLETVLTQVGILKAPVQVWHPISNNNSKSSSKPSSQSSSQSIQASPITPVVWQPRPQKPSHIPSKLPQVLPPNRKNNNYQRNSTSKYKSVPWKVQTSRHPQSQSQPQPQINRKSQSYTHRTIPSLVSSVNSVKSRITIPKHRKKSMVLSSLQYKISRGFTQRCIFILIVAIFCTSLLYLGFEVYQKNKEQIDRYIFNLINSSFNRDKDMPERRDRFFT